MNPPDAKSRLAKGSGFDWAGAYARLARLQTAGEEGRELAAEAVGGILRQRAAAYAKPANEGAQVEVVELLVFALGGSRFGLRVDQLEAVVPLAGAMPVPCTPPVIHGVTNYRGEAVAVLDLRPYFGLPRDDGAAAAGVAILVAAEGRKYGVLSEELVGIRRIESSKIIPAPALMTEEREGPLAGVTEEMVVLLNAEYLAHDPRLIVNEAD